MRRAVKIGGVRGGAMVLAALLVLTACAPPEGDSDSRLTAGTVVAPFAYPDVALRRHDGGTFSLASDTKGRYTLLFFGYTYCPDVCPIAVSSARAALTMLDDESKALAQVAFVSVDPARDSLERLAEWIDALGGSVIGLRASQAELGRLYGPMGIRLPPSTSYVPFEEGGPDAYLVPHPTALYVIAPDGLMRYVYQFGDATPQEIAADLTMLIDGQE